MKTFSDLKNFTKAEIIVEGGNAVPDVVRINQENSIPTVNKLFSEFLPKLKIKKNHTAILGSTGKKAPKQSSGDIDVAISATELLKQNNLQTFDDLMDHIVGIVKGMKFAFKDMRALGIISFAYPIVNEDGLQEGQKVQVDFMVVKDVKYAAWSFYSPSYLESDLKGVYRNFLNFNVAKNAKLEVKKIDPDTKAPIEWSRYWVHNTDGLQYGTQTNVSAKTNKVVKTLRTIEKTTISMKPDDVASFLYGPKYKANDLLTFEACIKAVMSASFPYKDKRKIILTAVSDTLQHEGYPIPDSLQKALRSA